MCADRASCIQCRMDSASSYDREAEVDAARRAPACTPSRLIPTWTEILEVRDVHAKAELLPAASGWVSRSAVSWRIIAGGAIAGVAAAGSRVARATSRREGPVQIGLVRVLAQAPSALASFDLLPDRPALDV